MPYSITTKDGITIDNIPDNVPSDAATLKERVAQIRAQKGGTESRAAEPDHALEAPKSGIVMGLRDPVDAGAQLLRRAVPDVIANKIDDFGNYLADMGLPVARSNGVAGVDKIVSGVNKQYDQQRNDGSRNLTDVIEGQKPDPGFDWGRLAGNVVNPVNVLPGMNLARGAKTLGSLAARGGVAGALGGLLQPVTSGADENFVAQKAGQAAGGAALGAVATPAITRAASGIGNAIQRLRPAASGPAPDINVAVNNVFQNQGVNPQEVSAAIRNSVTEQVQQALDSRTRIDPAAMIRRAEFDAVGLRGDAAPTAGQATRDPMQFAREKNLSGINIDGENALSARFQAQNQALQDVFDTAGATQATDRVTAGQTILNGLRQADAPKKQAVDDLYGRARGMSEGRVADLDRAHFSRTANEALDEGMYNSFLPANVRNLLNDITGNKGPFNVESAVQIDSLLSRAQRQAERGGDSAGASAIGIIRTKLHDTPFAQQAATQAPEAATAAQATEAAAARDAGRTFDNGVDDVVFRDVQNPQIGGAPRISGQPQGGMPAPQAEPTYSPIGTEVGPVRQPQMDPGQAAREAFEQARGAARSRFATIEQTPALKAALDEGAPDKFIQQYILNANVGDVQAMNKVLQGSPEAQAQARAQVADYLKRAAFGENPSGDKAFSADRYLRTISALGPQKLALFFSPEEVVRLNLAGKVASDINSIPVGAKYGTNTSGTAAAAINAISGILDKVPGGSVLGLPLNFAKRELGDYQTRRAINSALNPAAPPTAQPGAEIPPALVRAFEALGLGAGGFGGGSIAGSNFRD